MVGNFTCALCSGDFDTNAEQRTHMQSSWHIWNLKRRIASLSALPLEIFEEQVAGTKATGASSDDKRALRIPSEDAESSLSSSSSSEDGESDSQDSEDDSSFNPQACLFCSTTSLSITTNLTHMRTAHGLFIPDVESLDAPAFLRYLSLLITSLHECLYCGAVKSSAEGVRAHMRGKGHCKLGEEEIAHLEEFRAVEGEDSEDGGDSEKEDETEDGEDEEQGISKGKGIDLTTDEELHLPSGRTIGHRSRARYFQQHHRSPKPESSDLASVEGPALSSTVEEAAGQEKPHSKALAKLSRNQPNAHQLAVRANTEKGLVGLPEAQKRALRAAEKKVLRAEGRKWNQYRSGLEKLGNKQKYFRPDVPGPKLG